MRVSLNRLHSGERQAQLVPDRMQARRPPTISSRRTDGQSDHKQQQTLDHGGRSIAIWTNLRAAKAMTNNRFGTINRVFAKKRT
jgi:hypothetical protein